MLRPYSLLMALTLLVPAFTAAPVQADEIDDLEEGDPSAPAGRKPRQFNEDVREITRGFYAKSNVGSAIYLMKFRSPYVKPGTSVSLAIGQDFVDKERMSMAWEFAFSQGVHNGMHYASQGDLISTAAPPLLEGDLRTYTGVAMIEWSTYPSRRLGIGLRAGGGILYSPLLMPKDAYDSEVVESTWGVAAPAYHGTPHPLVQGGPNIEYYTKMSHFSVGIDADVFYGIGWDLGVAATGALKYTF